MFKIGEFSKMGKTSVKTLRYYDEIGLLKPIQTDSWSGYRLYSSAQLVTLHQIQSLRQVGISIENIKAIMSGGKKQNILEKRISELNTEIAQMQSQRLMLEFMLSDKEEEYFMNYEAVVKEIPTYNIFSKEAVILRYEDCGTIIEEAKRQVFSKYPELSNHSPRYCFMIYLDGEFKEKDVHLKYCEAIDSLKEDFDGIKFEKLPSAMAVTVLHKGSYDNFTKAYAYIYQWIEENNYVPTDAPRESYIDGPWNKENPEDWLTEIQIPVVKK